MMDTDALIKLRQAYTLRRLHFSSGLLLGVGAIASVVSLIMVPVFLSQIQVDHVLRLEGVLQAVSPALPVSHSTGGVVRQILVTEGEVVREGQLLMSLDASDLKDRHVATQRQVAGLMLQSMCLRAERDHRETLEIPDALHLAIGRLGQLKQMQRGLHECNADLKRAAMKRLSDAEHVNALWDQIVMHQQLSRSEMDLRGVIGQVPGDRDIQNLQTAAQMRLLIRSVENRIKMRGLQETLREFETAAADLQLVRSTFIKRRLDAITDELALAEQELEEMDARADARFLYATASGRVQRLRIRNSGFRIAKGAAVLEIAPLQTDFEVLATVHVRDLGHLQTGQAVSIQLSSGLPKPVAVPAQIQRIRPETENTRIVTFLLDREDLNRRDLLIGERSLNGLGERSEALISVQAKNAIGTLRDIVSEGFRRSAI